MPHLMRLTDMLAALQRTGRTGRHKEGKVVYILAAGGEEAKYKRGLQVAASTPAMCRIRCWRAPSHPMFILVGMLNVLNEECLIQSYYCSRTC